VEVGLPGYLAEIDPAAGGVSGSAPDGQPYEVTFDGGAGAPAPVTVVATSPHVQESLIELEGLRRAGLVDENEYSAKRREILARL
jgi:hypothetical protein